MTVHMPEQLNDAVCLTPLVLNFSAQTVHRVFFRHWSPQKRWVVELGNVNELAPFSCDRERGVITMSQIDFATRDDLRAALVTQFALAMSAAKQDQLERALAIEVGRAASIARAMHQLTLHESLVRVLERVASKQLVISHDVANDRILTHDSFRKPADAALLGAWIASISNDLEHEIADDGLRAAQISNTLISAENATNASIPDSQAKI